MRAPIFSVVFIALLALLFAPAVMAKRMEPAHVEPVTYNGVKYSAPNDDGRRGYVRAEDAKTGKTLYEIEIFKAKIDPGLETDVQWVFIKSLTLKEGKLVVTDERGRMYEVDLKTHAVTQREKN